MKPWEIIFFVVVAIGLLAAFYFGIIAGVGLVMEPSSEQPAVMTFKDKVKQRQRMRDIQLRQKQMMQDQKQKIRDMKYDMR